MLNLLKIVITTWTFALCCIPRQKSGNLHPHNDSRSTPPYFSPQCPETTPGPGGNARGQSQWCSGKHCLKSHPWLTPTASLSLTVPRWRPHSGTVRVLNAEPRVSSEARTTLLVASDNTMEHGQWSQPSSGHIVIIFRTHMLLFLIRKSRVNGTFLYIAHQHLLPHRSEAILRI